MIKKFIPQDFEECLMGLPIVRWTIDDYERESNTRPVMVVNHLDALKGIHEENGYIHVKAYTDLDDILATDIIATYFKEIIDRARNTSIGFSSLGSFVNSNAFIKQVFPMLVALNAQVTLKSYMKERRQDIKVLMNNIHLENYNEILYDFVFEAINLKKVHNESVTINDYNVQYFIAYNRDYNLLKFVLMLPNNRIVRFSSVENGYGSDNIFKIFIDELTKLSISEEYRQVCLEFYRTVFLDLMKGSL